MVRRGRVTAGWVRIRENEWKAGIAAAMKTEPDLCARLRHAIMATAGRKGVRRDVRDQYLRWINEVEVAIAAIVEAERSTAASTTSAPSVR